MNKISATFAWATPVRPEKLAAHFEAYLNLLPTISTLRLCHRFGMNSAITKLPVELLANIEELLVHAERTSTLKTWIARGKCADLQCEPEDHLSSEELQSITEKFAREQLESVSESEWEHPSAILGDLEDDAMLHLWGNPGLWMKKHFKRQQEYTEMGLYVEPFNGQSAVFTKHFGLAVWTSIVRIDEVEGGSGWGHFASDHRNLETVLTYLTLPGGKRQSKGYAAAEDEQNEKDFCREDGFVVGIVPPKLTESAKKRFERVLKVLDLEPQVHWTQTAEELGMEPEAQEEDGWPRLSMLISSVNMSPDL